MNKMSQRPCMNKMIGCSGFLMGKGEMYCSDCLEKKRNVKKDIEEQNKANLLLQENNSLKKQLELCNNKILLLQKENEKLLKENSMFHIKYEQLKIDYERSKLT